MEEITSFVFSIPPSPPKFLNSPPFFAVKNGNRIGEWEKCMSDNSCIYELFYCFNAASGWLCEVVGRERGELHLNGESLTASCLRMQEAGGAGKNSYPQRERFCRAWPSRFQKRSISILKSRVNSDGSGRQEWFAALEWWVNNMVGGVWNCEARK